MNSGSTVDRLCLWCGQMLDDVLPMTSKFGQSMVANGEFSQLGTANYKLRLKLGVVYGNYAATAAPPPVSGPSEDSLPWLGLNPPDCKRKGKNPNAKDFAFDTLLCLCLWCIGSLRYCQCHTQHWSRARVHDHMVDGDLSTRLVGLLPNPRRVTALPTSPEPETWGPLPAWQDSLGSHLG